MSQLTSHPMASLASEPATRRQTRAAAVVLLTVLALTVVLLPAASRPGPVMPGFALMQQTALVGAYALGTWMLFAQYWRSREVTLVLAAGGTLFTTCIVLLQLLTFPGVFSAGPLLGAGWTTTVWLWAAWHLGPPAWGLAVAATRVRAPDARVAAGRRQMSVWITVGAAIGLAGVSAIAATALLPLLPLQLDGANYRAMLTSGISPAIELVTLVALAAMVRATRARRSTLDLWIIVALALLALDNLLTFVGGARGSVGWIAGRLVALGSASTVVWAYLHEVDSLRSRAEAAVEELATTEARLRASQKMEAVGQLTGGIAHDFNNLLMVVTSGFDMIRRRPEDQERVVKLAEAGLVATDRGARLTRQLLTFARRQSLRPETVNPNALLIEFERLASRAAGETIKLNFALDAGVQPVVMDTAEFEAAVLNLVVNARDALTPRGGRVTIGSRNEIVAGATDGGLRPGEYVVVAVSDSGPGMTADIAGRAFEPFFTTKDFGKGSGLGLSQVYGFARAAGGDAVIQSEPGKGTVVELWLPRAASQQAAVSEPSEQDLPLRHAHAGEVVLAVEDEPDVLAAVVENLADLGYHVLAARDAAEALERLRGSERVDVLFSDVVMPGGMNGVQLASEAARLRPRLRILLTSGYTNQALEGDHALPPHLDILPKPYRRADLAKRLQLVMRAA